MASAGKTPQVTVQWERQIVEKTDFRFRLCLMSLGPEDFHICFVYVCLKSSAMTILGVIFSLRMTMNCQAVQAEIQAKTTKSRKERMSGKHVRNSIKIQATCCCNNLHVEAKMPRMKKAQAIGVIQALSDRSIFRMALNFQKGARHVPCESSVKSSSWTLQWLQSSE